MVCFGESEVERQVALREVPGLSVNRLQNAPPLGKHNRNHCAEAIPVRARTAKAYFEELDLAALSEVGHEYLRRRVELVGHNVQVAVAVDSERDCRTRATCTHDRQL